MSPSAANWLEAAIQRDGPSGTLTSESTAIDRAQRELGRFAQRHRLRTAELVNRACFRQAGERRGGRLSDVADIDRLQASLAARQQGQKPADGRPARRSG